MLSIGGEGVTRGGGKRDGKRTKGREKEEKGGKSWNGWQKETLPGLTFWLLPSCYYPYELTVH